MMHCVLPADVGFIGLQSYSGYQRGRFYPNNSAVALNAVEDRVYCLTNLTTCCTEAEGGVAGEWFLPGQTEAVIDIDSANGSTPFTTSRLPSAVRLNRGYSRERHTSGIFTCRIPDASGRLRTLHIYLYDGTYIGAVM